MKEDMSLSNISTVALHAAKVPTNVFSSALIYILTLDYLLLFIFYLFSLFWGGGWGRGIIWMLKPFEEVVCTDSPQQLPS